MRKSSSRYLRKQEFDFRTLPEMRNAYSNTGGLAISVYRFRLQTAVVLRYVLHWKQNSIYLSALFFSAPALSAGFEPATYREFSQPAWAYRHANYTQRNARE